MNIEKFKSKLIEILKADERIWNENKTELNETKLFDLIDKIDETIIALLLENDETREKFFSKIKDIYVFKTNDFKFFMEEHKINNSYTQYKNRIGLTDGKRFLKNTNDIVLNWPYKDCVLEGGQTTEEGIDTYFEYEEEKTKTVKKEKVTEPAGYKEKQSKRNEIFFNEILAQDEIDRLFDKKALINWKRYTSKGEEKVKEIKRDENGIIKDNLIIKGNNLLALNSIKSQFTGKVKLIYIDPPYNTGNDSFKYNDSFNHSSWLTFLKNRLDESIKLLQEDGIIFVSIDDTECAYLKVLLDDIFGNENYIRTISYQRGSSSGIGQSGTLLLNTTEYILVYAKNKNRASFNDIYNEYEIEQETMKRYKTILVNEGKRKLIKKYLSKSNNEEVKIFEHQNYEIATISLRQFNSRYAEILKEYIENFNSIFRTTNPQSEFQQEIIGNFTGDGLFSVDYTPSRGNKKGINTTNYFHKNGLCAWLKDTSTIKDNTIIKKDKISDFWAHADIPKADLANEGGVSLKRGKKPEQLLFRLLNLATSEGDIVLDFFLGSGTTSAVCHKMNRQYIGIEQLDYFENDSVTRLKNVINNDQSGVSKLSNWHGGGSFIYFELAKWNENAKEEIHTCKSLKELIKLFDTLYEKYFLNYNLRIKEFKEKVIHEDEFINLSLEEQKRMFLTMLDLNQMYVHLSEMSDKRFGISKEDQEITEQFYNEI